MEGPDYSEANVSSKHLSILKATIVCFYWYRRKMVSRIRPPTTAIETKTDGNCEFITSLVLRVIETAAVSWYMIVESNNHDIFEVPSMKILFLLIDGKYAVSEGETWFCLFF